MKSIFYQIKRLWQIRRIIKQCQLSGLFSQLELPTVAKIGLRLLLGKPSIAQTPELQAQQLRLALERLGPIFVKLGQALSTRPDLLPTHYTEQLSKLQDQVPAFDDAVARQIIEDTFGEEVDQIFAHIDTKPLASASVAQVHAAVLHNNKALKNDNGEAQTEVVIKILRPGIDKVIRQDIAVLYGLATFLDKYWSRATQFKPLQIIKEYDTVIHNELNLALEASSGALMAANFAGNPIIHVPAIYWDYVYPHLLVMERIHGTSVRDLDTLKAKGVDLAQLAQDGVEVFFKQTFEDNFFHADMHPGNIFVSDEGHWIAIDFGIMSSLTAEDKQYLAQMLLGFFQRDYQAIAKAHLQAQWLPKTTNLADFEAAIRMVCEPNFAKPIKDISFGKVLFQIFETMRRFELPVQPQLVLLFKTMLNIEGLGRQLYPELNLWDTGKPFLENWMKKQFSIKKVLSDVKNDWPQWQQLLQKLPQHIEAQQFSPEPNTVKKSVPWCAIMSTILLALVVLEHFSAIVLPINAIYFIVSAALIYWLPSVRNSRNSP